MYPGPVCRSNMGKNVTLSGIYCGYIRIHCVITKMVLRISSTSAGTTLVTIEQSSKHLAECEKDWRVNSSRITDLRSKDLVKALKNYIRA